jgi:hypothetical protein
MVVFGLNIILFCLILRYESYRKFSLYIYDI